MCFLFITEQSGNNLYGAFRQKFNPVIQESNNLAENLVDSKRGAINAKQNLYQNVQVKVCFCDPWSNLHINMRSLGLQQQYSKEQELVLHLEYCLLLLSDLAMLLYQGLKNWLTTLGVNITLTQTTLCSILKIFALVSTAAMSLVVSQCFLSSYEFLQQRR